MSRANQPRIPIKGVKAAKGTVTFSCRGCGQSARQASGWVFRLRQTGNYWGDFELFGWCGSCSSKFNIISNLRESLGLPPKPRRALKPLPPKLQQRVKPHETPSKAPEAPPKPSEAKPRPKAPPKSKRRRHRFTPQQYARVLEEVHGSVDSLTATEISELSEVTFRQTVLILYRLRSEGRARKIIGGLWIASTGDNHG